MTRDDTWKVKCARLIYYRQRGVETGRRIRFERTRRLGIASTAGRRDFLRRD